MCPVVRLSDKTYCRLEKHAVGFDTPSNVIERILDHFEDIAPEERQRGDGYSEDRNEFELEKRPYTNKEIQQKISALAEHLPPNELESLLHEPESKKIFGINFPLFVKLPAGANQAAKRAAVKTDDEVSRWSWKYEFERDGFVYAICTQWYSKNDDLVHDWLGQNAD